MAVAYAVADPDVGEGEKWRLEAFRASIDMRSGLEKDSGQRGVCAPPVPSEIKVDRCFAEE